MGIELFMVSFHNLFNVHRINSNDIFVILDISSLVLYVYFLACLELINFIDLFLKSKESNFSFIYLFLLFS